MVKLTKYRLRKQQQIIRQQNKERSIWLQASRFEWGEAPVIIGKPIYDENKSYDVFKKSVDNRC